MKNKQMTIFIALFILIILAPVISLMVKSEDEEPGKAWYEGRLLEEKPSFTLESCWSGEYFADYENYLKDNVFDRDAVVKAKAAFEIKVLRKKLVNDVISTPGGLLNVPAANDSEYSFEALADSTKEDLRLLLDTVEENGGRLVYVGAANQYSILREFYPDFMFSSVNLDESERVFFQILDELSIPSLNMYRELLKTDNYTDYYAKTDHHFNLKGALYTCELLWDMLDEIGIEFRHALPSEDELEIYPNYFEGSRNRKICFLSGFKDDFYVWSPSIPFQRWDWGLPSESVLMTLPSSPDEAVGYGNYMLGDVNETIIKTDRPELPNLLVFGDSFTNAMEMFMYTGFNEMRSLDLRHYSDLTITEYIEDYKPDVVIVVRDDSFYFVRDGNGRIE